MYNNRKRSRKLTVWQISRRKAQKGVIKAKKRNENGQ